MGVIVDIGDGLGQQVSPQQVNAAKDVIKNIPGGSKLAERLAGRVALASTVFAASNAVPVLGTAAGAIAAAAIIVGPELWNGLKGIFSGKENPWPKRVRKVVNSNRSVEEKFQAMWAVEQTAREDVKRAKGDDLRWARGGIVRARNAKNKLFTELPDGVRQRVERQTRIVQPPRILRTKLVGFPVAIVEINKLTDQQLFTQIKKFIAIKKDMNAMIRKGQTYFEPSPVFVRDQIERYRIVYAGVLTARIKTRIAIAERARRDAEHRRAVAAFNAFLKKAESDIRAFDVKTLKKKKQIDGVLAVAAAWRAQAVAVNATGVIKAIDDKVAEIKAHDRKRKIRNTVGIAAAAGTALKFLI